MKILIIESEEVLTSANMVARLKEKVMPIFEQGHDVIVTTKREALEHFNAHIVLTRDESMEFSEVLVAASTLAYQGKLFPEFIGLVTALSSDSLAANPNNISSWQFKKSLPFGWYTIDPNLVTQEEIVDWMKVFEIVVEHFKIVYTIEECKAHLKKWAQDYRLNWETIKESQKVINLIKYLDSFSPVEGLSNEKGDVFISDAQWKDFYKKAKKVFASMK
ncbi:MAG TPA: hypothetical protein PKZ16_00410 [bacterium]|nr:hypothetical protein [bacterium]HPL95876.1 hypothetical protein [bacterium]